MHLGVFSFGLFLANKIKRFSPCFAVWFGQSDTDTSVWVSDTNQPIRGHWCWALALWWKAWSIQLPMVMKIQIQSIILEAVAVPPEIPISICWWLTLDVEGSPSDNWQHFVTLVIVSCFLFPLPWLLPAVFTFCLELLEGQNCQSWGQWKAQHWHGVEMKELSTWWAGGGW